MSKAVAEDEACVMIATAVPKCRKTITSWRGNVITELAARYSSTPRAPSKTARAAVVFVIELDSVWTRSLPNPEKHVERERHHENTNH